MSASGLSIGKKKKVTSFSSRIDSRQRSSSPSSPSAKSSSSFNKENLSNLFHNSSTNVKASSFLQYENSHSINVNNINIDFDGFYREKVTSFDKVRDEFDYYLKLLEGQKDETHNLVWFNRNVIDEIKQQEIEQNDLNEKVGLIHKEIESLEKEIFIEQSSKNLRHDRISVLESLGRPVESDITYLIPERFSKHSLLAKAIAPSPKKTLGTPSSPNKKGGGFFGEEVKSSSSSSFLKKMKSGEIITLEKKLEVETLKIYSLLGDITTALNDLVEEKDALESHFTIISETEFKESQLAFEEVKGKEFDCYYLIAELLSLKYRIMIAQREEMEELEQLTKDRSYFQQKEEQLKEKVRNRWCSFFSVSSRFLIIFLLLLPL
jgi:hypothetical protein